ncbi:unnamed protein product [Durusdinium trenchii]|uniref:Uncharacterized protein n=1 Tax=Durusdinium trenchii TaxID=1381693 RepID=A0ABP0NM29_9DINO
MTVTFKLVSQWQGRPVRLSEGPESLLFAFSRATFSRARQADISDAPGKAVRRGLRPSLGSPVCHRPNHGGPQAEAEKPRDAGVSARKIQTEGPSLPIQTRNPPKLQSASKERGRTMKRFVGVLALLGLVSQAAAVGVSARAQALREAIQRDMELEQLDNTLATFDEDTLDDPGDQMEMLQVGTCTDEVHFVFVFATNKEDRNMAKQALLQLISELPQGGRMGIMSAANNKAKMVVKSNPLQSSSGKRHALQGAANHITTSSPGHPISLIKMFSKAAQMTQALKDKGFKTFKYTILFGKAPCNFASDNDRATYEGIPWDTKKELFDALYDSFYKLFTAVKQQSDFNVLFLDENWASLWTDKSEFIDYILAAFEGVKVSEIPKLGVSKWDCAA